MKVTSAVKIEIAYQIVELYSVGQMVVRVVLRIHRKVIENLETFDEILQHAQSFLIRMNVASKHVDYVRITAILMRLLPELVPIIIFEEQIWSTPSVHPPGGCFKRNEWNTSFFQTGA